jgi:hypothetical protein
LRNTPSGDTDIVEFVLWGYTFQAISAGPLFEFNPSISFMINFDPSQDKEARQRIDAVWDKLMAGGKALMPLDKHFNCSFEQTLLEETLAQLGATHIVLVGAATNWCVRATAYGALDQGYDLTLIGDAHTTETIELGTVSGLKRRISSVNSTLR